MNKQYINFDMIDKNKFYIELFKGLNALNSSSFPKKCANCGRVFNSPEQFLLETQNVSKQSTGLKQSLDDDENIIVEVFRNCPCGSTLMDFFSDRRDLSVEGEKKRKLFQDLINFLEKNGFDKHTARQELLKVLHGEKSEILSGITFHNR